MLPKTAEIKKIITHYTFRSLESCVKKYINYKLHTYSSIDIIYQET